MIYVYKCFTRLMSRILRNTNVPSNFNVPYFAVFVLMNVNDIFSMQSEYFKRVAAKEH